jgi:hypothetical protein
LRGNRTLRRMFGSKENDMAEEWRKFHNENVHNFTLHENDDKIKDKGQCM